MAIRINLRRQGYRRGRHVPCHRFAAGTGEPAPIREDGGDDHHQHPHHRSPGDQAAESAHRSHEVITGTPEALPTSFSNCSGSVVNSPSRMVLFVPW